MHIKWLLEINAQLHVLCTQAAASHYRQIRLTVNSNAISEHAHAHTQKTSNVTAHRTGLSTR